MALRKRYELAQLVLIADRQWIQNSTRFITYASGETETVDPCAAFTGNYTGFTGKRRIIT